MGLDLRFPLGLMFGLIGATLALLGVCTAPDPKTLGVNVNLWWGLFLLLFAAFMLLSAWRARNKDASKD